MNGTTAMRNSSSSSSSSSNGITEQDFTTPDRSSIKAALTSVVVTGGHAEEKKEDLLNNNNSNSNSNRSTTVVSAATLVTPRDSISTAAARKESAALAAEAAATNEFSSITTTSSNNTIKNKCLVLSEDNKQVRFDKKAAGIEATTLSSMPSVDEGDINSSSSSSSPSSATTQRGLVSRRGGRCGSPGRNLLSPPATGAKPSKEAADAAAAVLEFKTFRSPERNNNNYIKNKKRNENSNNSNNNNNNREENGSSGDTVLSLCSINCVDRKECDENNSNTNSSNKTTATTIKGISSSLQQQQQQHAAQNHHRQQPPKPKTKPTSIYYDRMSTSNSRPSPLAPIDDPKSSGVVPNKKTSSSSSSSLSACPSSKKSNVTFSPVPLPRINGDNRYMKTPIKSPTGGRFTSLPSLDDDALGSPGAIFLSPTRTPTYFHRKTTITTTTIKDSKNGLESVSGIAFTANATRAPLTPRTPKRELDRDRLLATPTDFAFDYGKPGTNGSFLESSNVLAWLHSPTANGLFSPGGLGSMLNTPRGAVPRAPNTPTFSTSFFFSDVAGLPRGGECASPKAGAAVAAAASDNEKRNGNGNGRGNNNIICISPLSSYKIKNSQLGPNSPKINYKDMFASPAERSGMAMLGASQKARAAAGVQRGGNLDAVHLAERDLMEDEDLSVLLQLASSTPRPAAGNGQSETSTKLEGSKVYRKNGESENLPSLQLPIIGGREGDGKGTRLTRKTHSRDHNDIPEDRGIRPTIPTSGGSTVAIKSLAEDKYKHKNAHDAVKKPPTTGSMHQVPRPYPPMPSHFSHHESPYYPSLHPGMPHGGSMRVVVGGPPPNRGGNSAGEQRIRTYTIGPRVEYPPPYPPPPSHYSHHRGVPPPPHIHPHYGRYPPHPAHSHGHGAHRHLPLYATHPKAKTTVKKQPIKVVAGKPGVKRPATSSTPKAPPSAKKAKKSSSQSAPKKKNRSPPIVGKAERQKAAATIQAVNQASGGKNDKAAALAAAILRGVTMRPSGKWQAQLYFAGKSRYIGVFDTREKAALAYEIAREKLKSEKSSAEGGVLTPKRTEAAVNAARKAAFEGVNERDPRLAGK